MALILHLTGRAYSELYVALVVGKYDVLDGYLPRERFSPLAPNRLQSKVVLFSI